MSREAYNICQLCGREGIFQRCAGCKIAFYCSREHQRQDWRSHKNACLAARAEEVATAVNNNNNPLGPRVGTASTVNSCSNAGPMGPVLTNEGSSENEVLKNCDEGISPHPKLLALEREAVVHGSGNALNSQTVNNQGASSSLLDMSWENIITMCHGVIVDLNTYGVCVVDNFMGEIMGRSVLEEVINLHTRGIFRDGQLVASELIKRDEIKNIRGDKIAWISGREQCCQNIQTLIRCVDFIIYLANKMDTRGKLGQHDLIGRTKSMVACYPGSGSHYVKHVDNPNHDGRCITAIYYLNLDWNVRENGGLLRIFPEGWSNDQVADIEPLFDRLIFFWSDRRNPHEVQPAYNTRFAITLWYFDRKERKEARTRYKRKRECLTEDRGKVNALRRTTVK